MSTKRGSRRPHHEIWSRTIEIETTDLSVDLRVDKPRGLPAEPEASSYLILRGRSDKPIKDAREVHIQISPIEQVSLGHAEVPCIGAIIQTSPHVTAVFNLARAEFDRAWSMVAGTRLKHVYMAFTRPLRGKALIVSASLSSEREEE